MRLRFTRPGTRTAIATALFSALILPFSTAGFTPKALNLAAHGQDAASEPIIDYTARFHPTLAREGMVVSQDGFASKAGREMLAQGGNAVDAAVATGFALAVTHPQAGNIGGGGFMMVYLAEEARTIAIDYREMAPAGAGRDLFLDENGDVDKRLARFSGKASGVPGTVMGMIHALEKYGTLPLKTVMAPAIRLAEEGFPMTWALHDSLSRYQARLKGDEAATGYFFRADGSVPDVGSRFIQADLAKTLKTIAAKGADGFYDGWVAEKLVESVRAAGGIITRDDLKAYTVKERAPITGSYRGYEIASMPPPSSGGVHIVQMLNVLEGWDMAAQGHNSADYINRLAEVMKIAYADRSKYLGDPDFFDVPIGALTSKAYARDIREGIVPGVARPSEDIGPAPDLPYESKQTTHYSVADAQGNMVANTYTLNFTYGNGKAVAGAGFLMNNEMNDFSAKPGVPNAFGLLGGEANAIEPGKRPLSSMTPTLLFKDGKPLMATGSPGGSTIITITLQTMLNVMDFDMNIASAVARPRVHHQWYPKKLFVEPGLSLDTLTRLKAMGYNVKASAADSADRSMGSANALMISPDGLLMGAADPRRPGSYAAGY
ncbi:gamma-glutamyltransferase [Yunchengibacter salinarum]|uniref:gamma-glutamyltransferase n=1 Tax=Yunchengibacter salinarum TaxID=3133399 RepID=UPI0035B5D7DE